MRRQLAPSLRLAPGFRELPKILGLMIGAVALMIATLTFMLYSGARLLAPEVRDQQLAGSGLVSFDPPLLLIVLTGMSLLLRYLLFSAHDLDWMLVSPLSEEQIFWAIFRRTLRPLLFIGAAAGVPLWGHLLGLSAHPWQLAAITIFWLSLLLTLQATAGLLALAGALACWLPLAVAFSWRRVEAHLDGVSLDALANAIGWHPIALSLLAVGSAGALTLTLLRRLVPARYSRAALIDHRDRPDPWWLRVGSASLEAPQRRPRLGSGTWLVRRLGRRHHALWCLVQRHETPEAFARRIPGALACAALGWGVAHWSLRGGEVSGDRVVLAGFGFVVAWVVGLLWLSTKTGHEPTDPSSLASQPVQEILPVSPYAYATAAFCAGSFLITLSLVLVWPFAWLSPLPAGWVGWSTAALWLLSELILGFAMLQLSPRLDSDRPPFSAWRLIAILFASVGSAGVLVWLFLEVLADHELVRRVLAILLELFVQHPVAFCSFVALALLLLEAAVILAYLRHHEKRRFDAAW